MSIVGMTVAILVAYFIIENWKLVLLCILLVLLFAPLIDVEAKEPLVFLSSHIYNICSW